MRRRIKCTKEIIVENIKNGNWIANSNYRTGEVELNWHSDETPPVLSIGSSINKHVTIEVKDIKEFEELGFEIHNSDSDKPYIFFNTHKEKEWISITNFRRYGWCSSPGYNCTRGYNGIIFANSVYTFDPLKYRDDEEMLRVELARLLGHLDKMENSEVTATIFSRAAQTGIEMLIQEAKSVTQMKSTHQTCSAWGDEENIELVINEDKTLAKNISLGAAPEYNNEAREDFNNKQKK